jgi:catechol 2,3-dioxygenase-like lactoylglutathione lyase family enzyme
MLGVTALERSVPFYRDKLGLKLTGQHEGFAFFDGGGVTFCLSEALARGSTQIPGATEVVFSGENVRGAHRVLAARGISFAQAPAPSPDRYGLQTFGIRMDITSRFSDLREPRKLKRPEGSLYNASP